MHFTRAEERIIEILRQHGKITTKQLLKYYYPKKGSEPTYGHVVVAGTVRALVVKTAKSRTLKVKKSERRGPYPSEVWIEESSK